MITLVFLAPAIATLALVLALVPWLVSRSVAKAEAPYTPALDSPEAWAASLDVALGEAWFDEAPMAPMRARKRHHVVPTMLALVAPSPAPHVYTARTGRARMRARAASLDACPMTLRSAA